MILNIFYIIILVVSTPLNIYFIFDTLEKTKSFKILRRKYPKSMLFKYGIRYLLLLSMFIVAISPFNIIFISIIGNIGLVFG